jgi:hypothetical protein
MKLYTENPFLGSPLKFAWLNPLTEHILPPQSSGLHYDIHSSILSQKRPNGVNDEFIAREDTLLYINQPNIIHTIHSLSFMDSLLFSVKWNQKEQDTSFFSPCFSIWIERFKVWPSLLTLLFFKQMRSFSFSPLSMVSHNHSFFFWTKLSFKSQINESLFKDSHHSNFCLLSRKRVTIEKRLLRSFLFLSISFSCFQDSDLEKIRFHTPFFLSWFSSLFGRQRVAYFFDCIFSFFSFSR